MDATRPRSKLAERAVGLDRFGDDDKAADRHHEVAERRECLVRVPVRRHDERPRRRGAFGVEDLEPIRAAIYGPLHGATLGDRRARLLRGHRQRVEESRGIKARTLLIDDCPHGPSQRHSLRQRSVFDEPYGRAQADLEFGLVLQAGRLSRRLGQPQPSDPSKADRRPSVRGYLFGERLDTLDGRTETTAASCARRRGPRWQSIRMRRTAG